MTSRDKVMKEVRSYTDRPCIDVEDDPLDWWCIEYRNYPCLSCLCVQQTHHLNVSLVLQGRLSHLIATI